ncbi:MAG: PDDEXK nuclease domain-containing protein [Candidatus Methanoperedens sp.]
MKKKSTAISSSKVGPSMSTAQQQNNLARTDAHEIGDLLASLREVIKTARQQVLHAVDVVQVQTCWTVGQHIVEFEQGGAARAAYGKRLLADLAASLTAEFGKGFDASNLRYMRLFYQAFPKCDALRHELSWTHYRSLLRIDEPDARIWYMNEAADQNWSTRALDRQIGTLYYERLLVSQDRKSLREEASANLATLKVTPREFVHDPVMLEFLGIPNTGKLLESRLEDALIENLQSFLLELGKGFAFVARQQRISTESKDFYIDLVFYNYLLKCFVLFDLKTTELSHQDIGQMDMYVRMYDDLRRSPKIIPRSASSFAPKKTSPSFVTLFCMATNSSLPPNTNSCCPVKRNCAPNSSANSVFLRKT